MSKRSPRLLFTQEERTAPELKKAVKKADKAYQKLEKVETKIPKKTVKKKQRVVDPKTGAVCAARPRQTAPTSVRWTKRRSTTTRSFPAIPTPAGSRSRPSSGSTPPPKPEKAPGIRSKPPKPRQRRREKPQRTQRKPVSSSPVTKWASLSWAASRQ